MDLIDTTGFQVCPEVKGEDRTDTRLLRKMVRTAQAFVRQFPWAPPIETLFLSFGVGGVLAVFLVRFVRPVGRHEDRELWIIVGDVPPAYFVTEGLRTPAEVLDAYCEWMEDWADRAIAGADMTDSYPVMYAAHSDLVRIPPQLAPTPELGRMLKSRVEFIREELIPDAAEQFG